MLTLQQAIDTLLAQGQGAAEASIGTTAYVLRRYFDGAWTLLTIKGGVPSTPRSLIPSQIQLTLAHLIPDTTAPIWRMI